jgi:hypothetical protein
MDQRAFWKAVTVDRSDLLDRVLAALREEHVSFCVIGGQAVNAYVDPVVSLDLDLVLAGDDVARMVPLLERRFHVERFAHGLNVSSGDSDLRVQIQLDPRYCAFIERAIERVVLGERMPVAAMEDVLQGKIWAALDPGRRGSKRLKDLADIARLIEYDSRLRSHVPKELLDRLL